MSGASTPLLAMLVSIQRVGEDSIAVSLFVDILDELANTVSDGKIQIYILRQGALPSSSIYCSDRSF